MVIAILAFVLTPLAALAQPPLEEAPSPEETTPEAPPFGTDVDVADPGPEEAISEPEPEPTLPPAAPESPDTPEPPPAPNPLHLSGYVQPELRFGPRVDPSPYFHLRRGRIKIDYTVDYGELLVQIDATQDGVSLKNAWGALDPPMPEGMALRVLFGLFEIPFGFDIEYSSSRRLFPERSMLARNMFPGERDLGLEVVASFADELLSVQLALQNGTPLGDPFRSDLPHPDGNGFKDLTARVGFDADPVHVGVSGLYGRGFRPEQFDDPLTPANESMPAFDFVRWAGGIDARFEQELPILGALDVYGELAYGRNMLRRTVAQYPVDDGARTDALTWYVAATQHLGDYFAVGARLDQLDPEGAGNTSTRITVLGAAFPISSTQVVLAYDIDPDDGGNNEGWLRLQAKF